MNDIALLFFESWLNKENGIHDQKNILEWINILNKTTFVEIHKVSLDNTGWFYDETSGQIVSQNRNFFQIGGFIQMGETIALVEQPILIQDEIGYLGFLCKEFDGVLHFLVQAKTEPGNVNKIQLSSTIQATKSNFTQKHGGGKPPYLDFFLNAEKYTIIVDQIQSEQASRFFKKRNRNIIILLGKNDDVQESHRHRWMTLGQLKELMKLENFVNMDCRTVLSCIPFYQYGAALESIKAESKDIPLVNSIITPDYQAFSRIFRYINNYKMFSNIKNTLVPLYSLKNWEMRDNEFVCKDAYSFKVVFCDITINGREVKHWGQPLFEAIGMATFGLFTAVENNERLFLVKGRHEIGSFDQMELGPTVQLEPTDKIEDQNDIIKFFTQKRQNKEGVKYDVVLSEEGGRFFCEQNYNSVIEIEKDEVGKLPDGYFWLNYNTLNQLVQTNNCLNIQLRNLLSLLEI